MKTAVRIVAGLLLVLVLLLAGFIGLSWAPDVPVSQLQARWAKPPSQFVEIGGIKVHLRDEGPQDDAVPVILLHGTSSSLHTWDGWAAGLSKERRVIRVDLPGFGLTGPAPDGDYSIAAYMRFMEALFTHFGKEGYIVAGNSFGGRLAWESALSLSSWVQKIVLVDAAGYPPKSESVPLGFRVAQVPVLNQLADSVLPRSLIASSLRNVYGDPAKVSDELVDRYYDLTRREGNRKALVQRFEQAPSGDGSGRIRVLTLPTLILWGGRDRLIPPESATRFHREISGSELVMFDDLGHVPQEEDPQRTLQPVLGFLGPSVASVTPTVKEASMGVTTEAVPAMAAETEAAVPEAAAPVEPAPAAP
ncbi:MAG TPA: alpha/beta hydrolase [Solimonas sp.]|nr:alpha/beta hydrolase [Solimonas sp.]